MAPEYANNDVSNGLTFMEFELDNTKPELALNVLLPLTANVPDELSRAIVDAVTPPVFEMLPPPEALKKAPVEVTTPLTVMLWEPEFPVDTAKVPVPKVEESTDILALLLINALRLVPLVFAEKAETAVFMGEAKLPN